MQYEFYINILRKGKRFSPWINKDKESDLEIVKSYYGYYSNEKATQALKILSKEQLDYIKQRLDTGGKELTQSVNSGQLVSRKMIEIKLNEPDDFSKFETLTRIGVASRKEKNSINPVTSFISKESITLSISRSCLPLMVSMLT